MSKSNLAFKDEELAIDKEIALTEISEVTIAGTRKIIDINSEKEKNTRESDKIIYRIVKRTIDIIGSLIGILILVPVTIIIEIVRKILKEDNGPLFYEHLRYGKDGKIFRMYKFRSMCMNADSKLQEYLEENEEAREEFNKYQKLKNDPRVTKLGRFLRKSSIDELPQMINILKGDMSFVGPRPVVEEEIKKYGRNKEKVLSIKPGLTGYWQVNGRSNTTYEERINMDLYYIDNHSLWLDIKIFLKTFIVVFEKKGAV